MARHIWQLQDAKNRFSELVNRALDEGPQIVTRRGEEVVVVVSSKAYQKTIKAQTSLLEFFRQSPLLGVELDLARDHSFPREDQMSTTTR
jgi:prevent-host-death family protein